MQLTKWLARSFLALTGWKPSGQAPAEKSFVLVAAPHTSNWDLPYLLAFAEVFGIRVSWMGKDAIFRWPFGGIMRALGGIPIDRSRRGNMVSQMAEALQGGALALVVPVEGTRGRGDFWKSGFYHIARTANVPVVMGFLDYANKRGGFGPALLLTGDVNADMDELRSFYSDKSGKYPEDFTPPRLKEEAP